MAKYTVTYKCGHTGTVQLFGTESDRKYRIAWYEENCVCPECFAAEQAAKREAEAQKYALPELVGSEKQVAWAEKIRSKFVSLRESLAYQNEDLYRQSQDSQENIETHKRLFKAFCDEFFGETSAKAWIDRRDDSENEYKFEVAFYDYIQAHLND